MKAKMNKLEKQLKAAQGKRDKLTADFEAAAAAEADVLERLSEAVLGNGGDRDGLEHELYLFDAKKKGLSSAISKTDFTISSLAAELADAKKEVLRADVTEQINTIQEAMVSTLEEVRRIRATQQEWGAALATIRELCDHNGLAYESGRSMALFDSWPGHFIHQFVAMFEGRIMGSSATWGDRLASPDLAVEFDRR